MKTSKIFLLLSIGLFGCVQAAMAQHRKPRTPKGFDNGIENKWEFRVSAGGSIGSFDDKAILIDAGFGYNFGSNVYLGVASGAFPYFSAIDKMPSITYVPLMLDATFRHNPYNDRWSPFLQLRGGYLFPTESSYLMKGDINYDRPGYTSFEISPGISFRPVRNIDLFLSMGYAVAVPGDDGLDPALAQTEHLLQTRLGLGFRGKPKSPTRTVMIEENARIQAQRQQEYEEQWAKQKAQEEEERRKADEERAERRRQRQSSGVDDSLLSALGLASQTSVEFFCHVTPAMVEEGASLENKLIQLASLAAGKSVSSIVILGYSAAGESQDASNVIEANNNADKVRAYLIKRYVIDRNLISTAFNGFEASSSSDTRPKGAIATIMIQKVADEKK